MLSAWSSPRAQRLLVRLPRGSAVSAVIVVLLVLCVAYSTV
jgi:hypothetical protein